MRRALINTGPPQLSVRRQADLVQVNRNRLSPTVRKTKDNELAGTLVVPDGYFTMKCIRIS